MEKIIDTTNTIHINDLPSIQINQNHEDLDEIHGWKIHHSEQYIEIEEDDSDISFPKDNSDSYDDLGVVSVSPENPISIEYEDYPLEEGNYHIFAFWYHDRHRTKHLERVRIAREFDNGWLIPIIANNVSILDGQDLHKVYDICSKAFIEWKNR